MRRSFPPMISRFCSPQFVLVSLALAFSQVAGLQAETIQLTLRQSLEMAKGANFDILIGEEAIESSQQAVKVARSGLLPSVSAGVSQGRSKQYSPRFGTASTDNRFDALLRARLAVLDFSQIAAFDLAKYDLNIARFELETVVQDVYAQITGAYFTHLRNQARLAVIKSNIERDTVLLDIARNQLEAGVATPIDVTRAEVQLASDQLEELTQLNLLFQSGMLLKRILNLNLDAELELERMADISQVVLETYTPENLQDVLANRSEYQASILTLDKARLQREAATWQRLPSIEVSGDWGYSGATFADELENQWSAGVGISMPLFEGGRIRANELAAQSAIRRQEKVVQQLQQTLDSGYRVTLDTIRSRYKQIAISQKRFELNQKELELATARFEQGVADNSDVVVAQANVAEAADGLVNAYYLYNLSRLELARTRGDVLSIAR